MGNLTALAVKAALANPGTYQDGDGLFLKVKKSGGASWMVRVQRDGKRQDIGLGSAKLVTLAEARQKAVETRKATRGDRRDVLAERKDEVAAKITFSQAARQYHKDNEAISIVSLICEHDRSRAYMVEEVVGNLPVMALPGGQAQPDREALPIDDCVDFGREAAS